MIEYRITPTRPTNHLFDVECVIAAPDPAGQVLALPSWIPGSYLVRDFARHIVTITAEDAAGAVALEKLDKQTWQTAAVTGALTVRYQVYAFDESVRAAYLNESRAFFNGTSVFLRVVGQEDSACEVDIEAPAAEGYDDWQVATTLPVAGAEERGFGRYRAESYAQLIDHPVEIAAFDWFEFEAGKVPHAMALTGRHDADIGRLAADLKKICESQQAMFGGSPLERYLFLTLVKQQGYGGLEHLDSTSLICSAGDLPAKGMGKPTLEYHRFLGLCSHEYFHLWNVKRIRPPAVSHSDLASEAPFRDLWAYEGITAYYDELFLVRSGVIESKAYLQELARTLTRVSRTPGRLLQSLSDSSYDAWTKFYKQDENAPNAIVSYYAKGSVVALCLDMQLRLDTDGRVSLDDVMRQLWARYGSQSEPVPEHGIEGLVVELAGQSYADFFARYVHGTEDPPVECLLNAFAVKVELRQRNDQSDAGGGVIAMEASDADMGIVTANEHGREVVKVVINGRAGELAGLQTGDEVVAVNGLRVRSGDLDKWLARSVAGDVLQLSIFRDDLLLDKPITLTQKPLDTWVLSIDKDADEASIERRQQWLHC